MEEQEKFSIQLQYTVGLINTNCLCYHRKTEDNRLRNFTFKFSTGNRRLDTRNESMCRETNGLARLPLHNICMKSIVLRVQWELFHYVRLEVLKSKRFRRGFICWLYDALERYTLDGFCSHNYGQVKNKCRYVSAERNLAHRLLQLHVIAANDEEEKKALFVGEAKIEVCMLLPMTLLNINRELLWSCLLLPLIHERLSLEYILACLSTLGGAYSSLGEHSKAHAKVAGVISIKQLSIALKMKNALLESHCKLYYAHSLMQMGRFKLASNIIRREYTMANSDHGISDPKLISCCKAAWIKLQYLKKSHKDEG